MGRKATEQRGLVGRVKSALMKPETYRIATAILRLVADAARLFDLFF